MNDRFCQNSYSYGFVVPYEYLCLDFGAYFSSFPNLLSLV